MSESPSRADSSGASRSLIIHAGARKTGSTALQWFFDQQREWLADQGVSFPLLKSTLSASGMSDGNALPIRPLLDPKGSQDELSRRQTRALHRFDELLVAAGDASTVLLSNESLGDGTDQQWRRFAALAAERGFTVRTVYYIRRIDGFLLSWYQQRIKLGSEYRRFEGFCADPQARWSLNFAHAAQAMTSAIGADQVDLRSYDGAQHGIVEDFVQGALGIAADLPTTANPVRNRSLSTYEVALLRTLNGIGARQGRPVRPDRYDAARRTAEYFLTARPDLPRDQRFTATLPAARADEICREQSGLSDFVPDNFWRPAKVADATDGEEALVSGDQEESDEQIGVHASLLAQISDLHRELAAVQQHRTSPSPTESPDPSPNLTRAARGRTLLSRARNRLRRS